MIYFIVKQLEKPGFDDVLPVVVNIDEPGMTDLGAADILRNPSVFEKFKGTTKELMVIWLKDSENPIVSFDPRDVNSADFLNITDAYTFIRKQYLTYNGKIPKEILNKMVTVMSRKYGDSAKKITLCVIRTLGYEEKTAEEQLAFPLQVGGFEHPDFMVSTTEMVEKHNAKFLSTLKTIRPEENVTLYQNNCTDELFIEIPDRMQLLAEDVQYNKIIPKRSNVCEPYPDQNAFSPQYKELGVAKYLIPMIEGNPENNHLEIQANEKKYYDALTEWVEKNMEEDFKDEIELAKAKGKDVSKMEMGTVIDSLSQEYLTELADRIYSWHWSHNKNMPIGIDDLKDDSDSEASESIESKYSYRVVEGESFRIENAILSLNEFLLQASTVLGYKVYVEAIVKLARWGERKCTTLSFDGLDVMFDLATNRVKKNIGSLLSYKIQLIDGCQHRIEHYVIVDENVADTQIFADGKITAPIGMVLSMELKNDKGDVITVPQYVSMPDVIRMIKSGDVTIKGVDYKDGEIVSDRTDSVTAVRLKDLIQNYTNSPDDYFSNPFIRDNSLVDLCIQFGISQNYLTTMSILQDAIVDTELSKHFKEYHVRSMQEVYDKLQTGEFYSTSSVLITNVAKELLPSWKKANEKVSYSSGIAEVIAAWDDSLKDYSGVDSFLHEVEKEQEEPVQETTEMSAFAEKAVDHDTSDSTAKEVEKRVNLTRDIKPDAVFTKLIDLDGNCVGAYVKENCDRNGRVVKEYTFVSAEYLNSVPLERVGKQHVSLLKVVPFLISDLLDISMNRPNVMRAYFIDNQTIQEYRDMVKKIMDQCLALKAKGE